MPNKQNLKAVEELTGKLEKAKSVFFTDYLGLDVASLTKLRSEFFKANVEYKVAKNTLVKLAAENNNIEGLDKFLLGPTAIAISYDEHTAPAKVLKEFTKGRELPEVKGILFDGEVLAGSEFTRIADLPSKEELLGKLVAMLNTPMTQFVRTIQSPMSGVVGVLNSLKDTKS